ncbi:MAG TPA: nuclear transport factor 2 family protein [Steroidobacteraceae bacterium]
MGHLRFEALQLRALAAVILLTTGGPTVRAGDLDDVLAADRAFAARASESGTQSAFQEFLAPDAILFRPSVVNGQEWLRTHEEATGRLEWSPTAGAVACDGSLAVTLGPWTYRQDAAVSTGYYLTLWRLREDGGWEVVLDHGIDGPAGVASGAAAATTLPTPWTVGAGHPCATTAPEFDLAAVDAQLNDALRSDDADVSLQHARRTGALALRDGREPAVATIDWPRDASDLGARTGARTLGVGVMAGSDLGYTYGEYFVRGQRKSGGEARAVFVRLWVRDGNHWQLLADLLTRLQAGDGPG